MLSSELNLLDLPVAHVHKSSHCSSLAIIVSLCIRQPYRKFTVQFRLLSAFSIHNQLLRAGKWHVGYKRAYDLFAGGLQKRITAERRKRLEEQHRLLAAKAREGLSAVQPGIRGAVSQPPSNHSETDRWQDVMSNRSVMRQP